MGLWQDLPEHLGHVPGTAGEVEDLSGVLPGNGGRKLPSPTHVHSKAEEAVETVVGRGQFVEEGTDIRWVHNRSLS
jgi:hypothetical protein